MLNFLIHDLMKTITTIHDYSTLTMIVLWLYSWWFIDSIHIFGRTASSWRVRTRGLSGIFSCDWALLAVKSCVRMMKLFSVRMSKDFGLPNSSSFPGRAMRRFKGFSTLGDWSVTGSLQAGRKGWYNVHSREGLASLAPPVADGLVGWAPSGQIV